MSSIKFEWLRDYIEREERITYLKWNLAKSKAELNSLIQTFKGVDQQIVRLKYIEGLSLEAIAETLGYSESHIQKRHAEIRKNVCFISEYMVNIHKYHDELETIYKDISRE